MAHMPGAVEGARDEVPDHLLGVLEVRNHSITKRTHRDDVRGRATEHSPRLRSDAQHLAGPLAHRPHSRFIQYHPPAPTTTNCAVGPEVNYDVAPPHPHHTHQPLPHST